MSAAFPRVNRVRKPWHIGSGAGAAPLAGLLFLLLAVLHTWPLAAAPWRHSLNHNADAELGAWTISWIARALLTDPANLFNGNIFAPERATLAYSEPMITPALVAAPVRWLGGSAVLAFNVSLVAGLTLTAWSAWFVVHRWTGSAAGALAAGALAAFNAHLLTRLPHLMAAHAWTLPLALYFADRAVERPARRDVALLAIVVAATAANSIYWLALAGVIVACVGAVGAVGRRWTGVLVLAAACVLGLLAVLPVLLPYLRLAAGGAVRPLEMVAQFSATPAGYLTSLSRLHRGWSAPFFRDDVNVLFAGVTAIALAAAGLAAGALDPRQRRRVAAIVFMAIVGLFLSLGPATAGYRWLYEWLPPLRGLRAAARFGYLYLLAIALLAGLGSSWLLSRTSRRGTQLGLAALIVGLVTIEALHAPIRTRPFDGIPAIYDLVAREPGHVVLVEAPFYPAAAAFENGDYVLHAMAHWRPLMNGASGFTPMSYRRRAESFWFFPDDGAIEAMKAEGATLVMVHLARFGNEAKEVEARLQKRTDLALLGADRDGRRLYRFR